MRPSLWFSVIFSCAAVTLAAQNQPPQPTPTVTSICIKVQPGKEAEFRQLAMDVSKPAAQVRADAGEFLNRFLLRSVYPAGMDAICDYSLVYVYPGFPPDPKTTLSQEAAYAKAHLSMKPDEFVAKRDALTRLRKTELWRLTDVIGNLEVGNYLRENFVKTDNVAPWLKFEHETIKPVHQARIELGGLKAWAVLALGMPSGSALPYNAMTVDVYKDWTAIGAPSKDEEAFKKVGKGDMQSTMTEAEKLRGAFVRTELYEIIDVTRPGKSTTTSAQR